MQIDNLLEDLRNNVCEVNFTKVDGSARTLRCSLMQEHLDYIVFTDPNPEKLSKNKDDHIVVVAVDECDVRSFYADNVIDYKIL